MKTTTITKKIMLIIAVLILTPFVILGILGSKNIHVEKELTINKETNAVWGVMGLQFAEVHLWSSNFMNSKPGGTKVFNDLEYSERVTITERGETIQVLDEFDSKNYSLKYHITEGMPGIAKSASGTWSLKASKNNQTKVTIAFDMETKNAFGYLLSSVIKLKIGKSAEEIAEELKFYVENGKAHPRNTEKSK
jgi:hypothetical protein